MGKKAVNLLIHTVLIIFTIVVVILTGLAMAGAWVSPDENGFMALMALGLPALLATDLLMILYWIFRRRWWFVLPLLAMGANYQYYPRIFQLPSKQVFPASASANTIRVATYNVNYFGWDELPVTVDLVARHLRAKEVDVVCFQEFASTEMFTADSIGARLGLPYHAIGHNSMDYDDIVIFSRYPLHGVHLLVFANSPNAAMWADMDVNGQKVRVVNAHLQTTSVNWEKDDLERQMALGSTEDQARAAIRISNIMKTNFRRRAYQATQIAHVMDTTSLPVIYCGDSNDTPSSYVYNVLTGEGKSRTDGFLEAGKGYGYTYHNMKKLLRIDYMMYSPGVRGVEYDSPDLEWSDHNPVIMQMELL